MRRRRAERIRANGLQVQIHAQAAGVLLLKTRDLRLVEIGQQRIRQREPRIVVAFERRRIERQRLAEPLADLFHHAVRHAETRLFAKLFQLIGRERELLSFGLGQRPAKFFLLRGNALFLAGTRLRDGRHRKRRRIAGANHQGKD